MRITSLIAVAALVSAPVAAKPMSPFARETAVWQSVKDNRLNAFVAYLAPTFVSLYEDGTHDRAGEVQLLRGQKLRSFAIHNFSSRMVDDDDMLMTYTVEVRGTQGKTDVSGRYRAASVWHRTGNNWLAVYHTEIRAK